MDSLTKITKNKLSIIILFLGIFILTSAHSANAIRYPTIFGDNTHEWITNVTFGTINKSSAQNSSGFGDYSYDKAAIMTRVTPGNVYPLSITIHPDTEWCDEYIYAFFDWNKDGDFSDSGEKIQVAANTCSPGPHRVNIKIPNTAGGGETRMRIVLKYFNEPKSFGNIPEGEAEDYTIVFNYPIIFGDNRSEWITNVTFSNINKTTSREYLGYGDYSIWSAGQTANVTQGETYPLHISIWPDSTSPYAGECYENITAYFDWNQDGDFYEENETFLIASHTCLSGPHILNIPIPDNALPGRSLMRVVLRWLWGPLSSGYISGEAEDYTFFVNKKSPWILFIPAILGQE